MVNKFLLGCWLLAVFGPGVLRTEDAPTLNLQVHGFGQFWLTAGDSSAGGALLKHLRVHVAGEPMDGVRVVVMPELAGGISLLDGYVSLDLEGLNPDWRIPLPLLVTLGQFKTPFGQNRMYSPDQLYAVDYSPIDRNVMFGSSFWDDGIMLTYLSTYLRADVAAVEGLGPNLASPNGSGFGLKQGQDFAGRLETYLFDKMLTLGGSIYQGYGFSRPDVSLADTPSLWTGGHARLRAFGNIVELEGEWINRDVTRWGSTGQLALRLTPKLQAVLYYDHIEDYDKKRRPADLSQLGGGFNWMPLDGLRLSIQMLEASANTVDLSQSGAPNYVVQTQASF